MGFPVWKSSVPEEDANLSSVEKREKYLAGYINRQYCTVCDTLRPYLQGSGTCLICNREDLYVEDGTICPKCKICVINEVEGESIHLQMKITRSTIPHTETTEQLTPKGKTLLKKYLEKLGLK